MKGLMFLPFVALTFLSWRLYGPTLHLGQDAFGAEGQRSAFRPFICVGLAYFMVAVLVPALVLRLKGESGFWSLKGFIWSFAAGAIGAVGALGIILALKFGGAPIYVMPLVFGCAPVVNTIFTMLMAGNIKQASWPFYVGIIIVAIGAAGVLVNKPSKPASDAEHAGLEVNRHDLELASVAQHPAGGSLKGLPGDDALPQNTRRSEPVVVSKVRFDEPAEQFTDADRGEWASTVLRGMFILMTALCWGAVFRLLLWPASPPCHTPLANLRLLLLFSGGSRRLAL